MAEGNVTRLISLINDLLDIEKMESGKLKMELTGCSIGDVFHRSLAAVVSFAQQQQVPLVMEPTYLRAIADGDRLVQVLKSKNNDELSFQYGNYPLHKVLSVACNFSLTLSFSGETDRVPGPGPV